MAFSKDMHLMIVDDSPLLRKIHGDVLRGLEITNFSEAEDGKPALEKMLILHSEGNPVHLVLLDANMPKMSGIEVLTAIRKLDQLKNIPVIMVTGEVDRAAVIEFVKAGVNGYIIKPMTAESLMANINKIFTP